MAKRAKKEKDLFDREISIPWYVWGLVILAIALIVFWIVFSGFGKVNYKGMVFQAEKYGTAIVYHNIYYYNTLEGETIRYNLYVYNKPNKNNVPINAQIVYPKYMGEVKISLNAKNFFSCPESMRAIGMLSGFIVDNGFTLKVGTANKELAVEKNMTFMDCTTHPNDFMISVSDGEQTRIIQEGNCYKIEVANCEIQKAVEKFMIESVVQARERAKRGY